MLTELAFVVLQRLPVEARPLSLDVVERDGARRLVVGVADGFLEYGCEGTGLVLRRHIPTSTARAPLLVGDGRSLAWIARVEHEMTGSAFATLTRIAVADGSISARHRIELSPRANSDEELVVCGIDDVTGDGVEDLVLTDCAGPSEAGRLLVISAASGRVVGSVGAPSEGEIVDFGQFLRAAGDWNGDGVGEILASAPDWSASSPGVALVDPRRCAIVRMFRPSGEARGIVDGYLTTALCIPDADGDGVPEVVVGWSRHSWAGPGTRGGEVQVLSGATGRCIARIAGESLCEYLGQALQLVETKAGVTRLAILSARELLLVEVR